MEGFWSNTYVWIGAALLVIFFGMRAGNALARSLAKKGDAGDPLGSADLKIAQKLEIDGKLDLAAKAYQQVIDRFPGSETGWIHLGYLQKKRRDFAAAAAAFAGAVRINPDSIDALVEVGSSLWAAGDLVAAESAYREVLLKEEPNPDAHAALGAILDETGRGALAAPHLERFIALAGDASSKRRRSMLLEARERLARLRAAP